MVYAQVLFQIVRLCKNITTYTESDLSITQIFTIFEHLHFKFYRYILQKAIVL